MKLTITPILFFLIAAFSVSRIRAQVVPPTNTIEYSQMKQSGQIPSGPVMILHRDTFIMQLQPRIQQASSTQSSVACNCMIPIDASFSVVPMSDGVIPDYRNDDGSSTQINFPFNFCFYGQTMTNCYINNNGNISFGASYGTFTANSFPDPNFVMIAPFWGDVDTRNLSSGLVYYKITSSYMVIHWKMVDYYDSDLSENSQHQSLYNDFQLIITNGSDPILPSGNNVSFCYGDMQWTTGDASGGNNGFGGAAATVGVNRGNGTDYIQIGRFDQPGTSYDGPFGNPDGISWLDNQTFYFDVCNNGSGNNLPPIVNSPAICDTLYMCVGDSIDIAASFLSPEQAQITTASMNSSCLGFSIQSNVSGNPAVIDAQLIANVANLGLNTITITGTDDGAPPAVTSVNVYVEIVNNPYVNFTSYPPSPLISGTIAQFVDLSQGAVSWYWDFGDGTFSTLQNPLHNYTTSSDTTFVVSLTIQLAGGCTGTDTLHYEVFPELMDVIAPNVITANGDGVNDIFQFQNLSDYPGARLEVYNRWGNLVYSSEDYQNEWKPQVVAGVYYYVLSWRSDKKPLTGFFEVIR